MINMELMNSGKEIEKDSRYQKISISLHQRFVAIPLQARQKTMRDSFFFPSS
jgi:hypothetical protein